MLRAGPTEGRVPSARRQQSQRPRGHRRVQPLADTRCRIRARTRLDWSGPPERCCIGEDRVMLPATRLYHHRLPASEAPAAKPMPARGTTPGDGTHPTEAFSLLPDERDARLRSGSGSALLFATRAEARDAPLSRPKRGRIAGGGSCPQIARGVAATSARTSSWPTTPKTSISREQGGVILRFASLRALDCGHTREGADVIRVSEPALVFANLGHLVLARSADL